MEVWDERRSGEKLARKGDHRGPSERDLSRLIHSAAFRRLQSKTQVLGIGESDFHRTRLTHSMEVAQIGRGLIRNLKIRKVTGHNHLPDVDRILTICLAHDLGHPPFGHGGEIALNCMMRNFGGFEGNGQTLRILSRQEAHTNGYGLDLTRRTLLGILKYPAPYSQLVKRVLPLETLRTQTKARPWKPPKCFHNEEMDVVKWILEPLSDRDRRRFTTYTSPTELEHGKTSEKSLDTSVMDLADDIAYGVHDFEDGVRLGLVSDRHWKVLSKELERGWGKKFGLLDAKRHLFSGDSSIRKRAIGGMVNALIVSSELERRNFGSPLLRYRVQLRRPARRFLDSLRNLITSEIIKSPEVQTLEYRGQQIIMQLFQALSSEPERLMKKSFITLYQRAKDDGARARVVCDYIAGMTDEYATRLYERLFMPRQGTVFTKL